MTDPPEYGMPSGEALGGRNDEKGSEALDTGAGGMLTVDVETCDGI